MRASDPIQIAYFPGIDGTGLFNTTYYQYLRDMGYKVKDFTYDPSLSVGYDAYVESFYQSLKKSKTPWIVIGESFGGPLAARIAHRLGDQCAGLGQIVTFHHAPMPCSSVLMPLMDIVSADWIPQAFIKLWFRTFTNNPEHLKTFASVQDRVPKSIFHLRAKETLGVDTRDILRSLKIPIGVLHASSETILLHSEAREFSHLNPRIQEMTLDGSHLLVAQKPLEVAAWTHQFVTSLVHHAQASSDLECASA